MNTMPESHTITYAALLGVLVAALAVLYLLATEPAPTHIVTVYEVVDNYGPDNRLEV